MNIPALFAINWRKNLKVHWTSKNTTTTKPWLLTFQLIKVTYKKVCTLWVELKMCTINRTNQQIRKWYLMQWKRMLVSRRICQGCHPIDVLELFDEKIFSLKHLKYFFFWFKRFYYNFKYAPRKSSLKIAIAQFVQFYQFLKKTTLQHFINWGRSCRGRWWRCCRLPATASPPNSRCPSAQPPDLDREFPPNPAAGGRQLLWRLKFSD